MSETDILWLWADIGIYVSLALASITLFSIFLHKKGILTNQPKAPLSPELRTAQPRQATTENKSLTVNTQELTKQEQQLQKMMNDPNVELEGDITAFGTKVKFKKGKPQQLIPFPEMDPKEIDTLDKNYQEKMKKLIKDAKPPHVNDRNKQADNVDDPETPEDGWEDYLEKTGVIPASGNKKK